MLQLIPFLFDHHKKRPSGSRFGGEMMSGSRLSLKASPRPMDYLMDTGNPTLNCTLDGVLKIGGVGAAHAVTQEAYSMMRKGIEALKSPLSRMPGAQLPSPRQHMEKIILEQAILRGVHGLEKLEHRVIEAEYFLTSLRAWLRDGEAVSSDESPQNVMKAGKEGLQWGMVAGIYAGFEYGMEKARRGKQDWKNAAVGGALTGVILSVSDGRVSQDKMVRTVLTASALATAADILKLL